MFTFDWTIVILGFALLFSVQLAIFRRSRLFRLFKANPIQVVRPEAIWFSFARFRVGTYEWPYYFTLAIDNEYLHIHFNGVQKILFRPSRASIPLNHLRLLPSFPVGSRRVQALDSKSGLTLSVYGSSAKALGTALSAPNPALNSDPA